MRTTNSETVIPAIALPTHTCIISY